MGNGNLKTREAAVLLSSLKIPRHQEVFMSAHCLDPIKDYKMFGLTVVFHYQPHDE